MPYRLANPYTLALVAVAVGAVALAAVAARRRRKRAALPLALFLVGEGFWALGDAFRIAALEPSAVLLWNDVAYFGIVVVLPGYILFFAAYADRGWWFRPPVLGLLWVASTVAYALVLTNRMHGLWLANVQLSPGTAPPVLVETWGPAWYVWAGYSYAVVMTGTYYAIDEYRTARSEGTESTQAALILGGIAVPLVTNGLFVLGLVPFDPAPFSFGITGLAFTLAIFRYRLLGVTAIARDMVVETMDSGVLVLDTEGVVVDANRRAADILETRPSELLEESIWDVLTTVDADFDRFRGVRDASDTIAVDGAGGVRHFDVDVSPVTDALGSDLGRVVVFTEVTDAVRRRQRLQEQADRLRRQNERLERFAGVVSHDLRNPLNVAKGNLELLDASTESTAAIARSLDRMETIIDEVLALSQAGAVVDDPTPVALDDLARDAWETVHNDTALLTVAEGLPTVEADRSRVQQLFENLYRNAIEHGAPGPGAPVTAADGDRPDAPGAAVTVTVGPLSDNPGFYVADDGPGIPPADRETVFERGYTTAEDGSGFGLSIVAEIAAAHGWELDVTESDTGGARFEFAVA